MIVSMDKLKFRHAASVLLCLLAFILCGSAIAQNGLNEFPVFSFDGYGTAGLAHSSESRADFMLDDTQNEGAGYSQTWSPHIDSRIGAQLAAQFSPRLRGVLQLVSEQQYDGTYRPQVEWAYFKHEFTPDFSVRIGRGVFPGFLVSDYRKVGYAIPWVRAPTELYGLAPISTTDGVELNYNKQFGEYRNLLSINVGESAVKLPEGIKLTGEKGWGVSDTLELGDATLRASYFRAKQKIEGAESYEALLDMFRNPAFDPEGQALADKYAAAGKALSVLTLGASYDPGKWFAMGEWGLVDFRSAFGKKSAWYLSSGYRWGKFTPYLIFSKATPKSNTSDPGLEPTLPGATTLNAALNQLLIASPKQKTISVGLRWDAARNMAIKAQYDYTDIGAGSYGTLNNRQATLETGGHFSVFSVVVDFLF